MAVHAAGDEVGFWVDAAPFRAQLHHLMGGTALTAAEVGVAAGLSARLGEHLAYGRNGRVLRKVSPETGRRLMMLSVEGLRRQARRRPVGWTSDQDGFAA